MPTKVGESPGWSGVRTHEMGEIQSRPGRSGKNGAEADREGIIRTERVEPDGVLEDLDGVF